MAILVSRLLTIADGCDAAVAEAISETAEFILMWVRIYAPVDTGALRDSYEIEVKTPLHLFIGSILLYAMFQELGFHHYQTGQYISRPHLVPATLQGELFLRNAIERKLKELVKG